jgi:hypothetical protein
MKKITVHSICYLSLILIFSCQKSKDLPATQTNDPVVQKGDPAVINAKQFFESSVLTSQAVPSTKLTPRHDVKKTPEWDKAYVIEAPEGDIVVAPLKYEKAISYSDGKGEKIALQSKLRIFKEKTGRFKAEVHTYFPDPKTGYKKSRFEGTIVVEDWVGNDLRKLQIKNGKQYVYNTTAKTTSVTPEQSSTQMLTDYCWVIHWYICDVEGGILSNCSYLYTEYSPACNEGLPPCSEGYCDGGGGYEEEYFKRREVETLIGNGTVNGVYWTAWSLDGFKGRNGNFIEIWNKSTNATPANTFNWGRTSYNTVISGSVGTVKVGGDAKWWSSNTYAFSAYKEASYNYSALF